MANTFELIASSTVGSGGATVITFSSIASTYTDLRIVFSWRISSNGEGYPIMRFNGDTGANYSYKSIIGTGSAAVSGTGSAATSIALYAVPGTLYTANTFSSHDVYVPNYAGSNYKSISTDNTTENNATVSYMQMEAGLWSSTSAITSITLTTSGPETLSQYSTAYLYGIKNS